MNGLVHTMLRMAGHPRKGRVTMRRPRPLVTAVTAYLLYKFLHRGSRTPDVVSSQELERTSENRIGSARSWTDRLVAVGTLVTAAAAIIALIYSQRTIEMQSSQLKQQQAREDSRYARAVTYWWSGRTLTIQNSTHAPISSWVVPLPSRVALEGSIEGAMLSQRGPNRVTFRHAGAVQLPTWGKYLHALETPISIHYAWSALQTVLQQPPLASSLRTLLGRFGTAR